LGTPRAEISARATRVRCPKQARAHPHPHAHGIAPAEVLRSRAGLGAVALALFVLGLTALAQAAVYLLSGSVALLADLVHNAGDAATALPVGLAFALRSSAAERWAGRAVIAAIFASACITGYEAISRLIEPREVEHVAGLAAAGLLGFIGNWLAAGVRTRAGRRLASAALVADGDHARADAYVSLSVIASAAALAIGVDVADPLIGLAITVAILRITWVSWLTVRASDSNGA
jgi:cation diffusion facilitator family transporter